MAIILVVDDDPVFRTVMAEALEAVGHLVIGAEDGAEVKGALDTVPVDLVLLDMVMPNQDGLETIMELRASWPQIRILAVSSGGRYNSPSFLEAALSLGAHAALPKPVSHDALVRTVAELLTAPVEGQPVALGS